MKRNLDVSLLFKGRLAMGGFYEVKGVTMNLGRNVSASINTHYRPKLARRCGGKLTTGMGGGAKASNGPVKVLKTTSSRQGRRFVAQFYSRLSERTLATLLKSQQASTSTSQDEPKMFGTGSSHQPDCGEISPPSGANY
jgi:methylmalonyl-CoA mutase N-terminal domain/subunit